MQPDLKQGVPSADLKDMLAGEVDGEAVLLVRRGNFVHAIGGTCTHYSAPLVDGLVVGDTIRCPWHHACFDLRTGEPLRAPALLSLPVFDVEERDGTIRVTGKRSPGGGPTSVGGSPRSVGIIGTGAAGHAAADMAETCSRARRPSSDTQPSGLSDRR